MQAVNRDEIFVTTVRVWKDLSFQDVAKKGLKYGGSDPEAEKKQMEEYTEQYRPLLDFSLRRPTISLRKLSFPTVWLPALVRSSSMRMVTPPTWRSFSVSRNALHANLCS